MAKFDKKIRDSKVNNLLQNILDTFHKEGQITESILNDMKALRERFIEHKQPTIVKSIRLAYEHIEKYGDLLLDYWDEEEDGELTVPLFEYYIGLLANPTNKYNRDEIKEFNILLKESLDESGASTTYHADDDGEDSDHEF